MLAWIEPPRLVSEIREVRTNQERDFLREGELIEGEAKKEVSIYLPLSLGDSDKEYRYVQDGTFMAPNPQLNEGSPKSVEIDFEKIRRNEKDNVLVARWRQLHRLCQFGNEILNFLKERRSSDTLPFAPDRIDYWSARLGKSEKRCGNAALAVRDREFTGKQHPELASIDRLKLSSVLEHLPYEEQVSSAETLLERVLRNLELPKFVSQALVYELA